MAEQTINTDTRDGRLQVFISYSHKDWRMKDYLLTHLRQLTRKYNISVWHDGCIVAGQPVEQAFIQELMRSDIILLLVSANYMDSYACFDVELQRALARHAAKECIIIPVILKPVGDLGWAPFGDLLRAPRDGRPISTFNPRDLGYADAINMIDSVIEAWKNNRNIMRPNTHTLIETIQCSHPHSQLAGSEPLREDRVQRRPAKAAESSTEIYSPLNESTPHTAEAWSNDQLNVCMGLRSVMDRKRPISDRLKGTTEITFVNFASTAFITGPLVDSKYDDDEAHHWLQKHLSGPDAVKINIILTEPGSYADTDASRYKMYPHSIQPEIRKYFTLSNEFYNEANRELHQFIIRKNFNQICDIMLRKKLNNINIFSTDIALPVGVMQCKYQDSVLNSIQVNIYLPCIGVDDKRPTFTLMEHDEQTRALYNVFDDMIRDLPKVPFRGHPNTSFLFKSPIVHRAKLNDSFEEMSRDAVLQCAKLGYPVEVDLLPVADEIVVCRDHEISVGKLTKPLSMLTKNQLRQFRKERTKSGENKSQIMTLPELLTLVNDVANGAEPIPLLLELKERWDSNRQTIRNNVIRICRILKHYEQVTQQKGKYALHAANPLVIRYVKDYDVRIPCGWITIDFDAHRDIYSNVSEEYKRIHSDAVCFGGFAYQEQFGSESIDIYYAIPDFVSCKIGDFSSTSSPLRMKCEEFGIKRLGWTATTQEHYHYALEREHFDNLLIENFEP